MPSRHSFARSFSTTEPQASAKAVAPKARAAFTLIELLVVIAIIAVLASILMPALSSARERARRVVCLSNQRQMYTGAALFASDHDDILPAGGNTGSNPGMWLLANFAVKDEWLPIFPDGQYTWSRELATSYLGLTLTGNKPSNTRGIVYCPSNPGDVSDNGSGSIARMSYATPGLAIIQAPYTPPFALPKATRLWEGSVSGDPRAFSYDASAYNVLPASGADNGRHYWPDTPHQQGGLCAGVNIVTTDGAGKWLSMQECRPSGWGYWMYYNRVVPKNYEILVNVHRQYGSMKRGDGWEYTTSIPGHNNATVTWGENTNGKTTKGLGAYGYFQP